MKNTLIALLVLALQEVNAQTKDTSILIFSGYTETYFAYDFNRPASHVRPGFLYSHNRHNEFNINLAFLKAAYSAKGIRANLAMMAGTYTNANLAAEPGVLKNIYEANVGMRFSSRLWADAGVFSSHIGFESAISKDCWSLTRSMSAENSPYYETGAKVTFIPNGHWTLTALLLNGWQRMYRVYGNSTPAFGTQITYKSGSKTTLNYSTFIGSDQLDSLRLMRVFHNLYGIFEVAEHFGLTAGFDLGTQQKAKGRSEINVWYTPVLIGKWIFTNRYAVAARVEYYCDPGGVIIAPDFRTSGYSLNFDYAPRSNAVFRIEGRLLKSKNAIFAKDNGTSRNNFVMTTSLAVSF